MTQLGPSRGPRRFAPRRPWKRTSALAAAGLLSICLAEASMASGIAGAGPCAEEDPIGLAIGQGAPQGDDPSARHGVSARSLGPARHRFQPTPVAASPSGPSVAPPSAGNPTHPGACNTPGSVCGGVAQANPLPPQTAPSPRRPRRRPPTPVIVVDPDPDGGCGGPGFECSRGTP